MTMTREQLAEENRKLAEAMHEKAKLDAISLRDTVRDFLRAKLPGGFMLDVQDTKGYADNINRNLVVKASDGHTFTLHFIVQQVQTRWGRVTEYQPCIQGSNYERDGRTHRPEYIRRKNGTYNLALILVDIEKCIERKRYVAALDKNRNAALSASTATLDKVRTSLGGKRTSDYDNSVRHDVGPVRVNVSAGQISSGNVKVTLELRDPYINAEQVLDLIAKLGQLK